jgi:hypothetical protein
MAGILQHDEPLGHLQPIEEWAGDGNIGPFLISAAERLAARNRSTGSRAFSWSSPMPVAGLIEMSRRRAPQRKYDRLAPWNGRIIATLSDDLW